MAEILNNENYELLSENYYGINHTIKVKCPNGHIFNTNMKKFFKGVRCNECRRNFYSFIKKFIENEGYKLLSEYYNNAHEKIKLKCPEGHVYYTNFNNFKNGKRCPYCYGNAKHTLSEVKRIIKDRNHALISDYYGINEKIKLKCPEGHVYFISFKNFKDGGQCPYCLLSSKTSNPEKEIQSYVERLINENKVIFNDRNTILNKKSKRFLELDVWIPNLSKAIEFNGKYWHSSDETKERDKIKQEECQRKGIDLMIINEQDWLDDKEGVFKRVRKFILEEYMYLQV